MNEMTAPVGNNRVLMNEVDISTSTLDGEDTPLPKPTRDEVACTIDIPNGNATVQVQGKTSGDAGWGDLLDAAQTQATAVGTYSLAYFPYMRAVVTGASSTPDVRVEVAVT